MRRLVIVATKFSRSPEADTVLKQRKWLPIEDKSTYSEHRKLIDRGSKSTPLIGIEWEWIEYGD